MQLILFKVTNMKIIYECIIPFNDIKFKRKVIVKSVRASVFQLLLEETFRITFKLLIPDGMKTSIKSYF